MDHVFGSMELIYNVFIGTSMYVRLMGQSEMDPDMSTRERNGSICRQSFDYTGQQIQVRIISFWMCGLLCNDLDKLTPDSRQLLCQSYSCTSPRAGRMELLMLLMQAGDQDFQSTLIISIMKDQYSYSTVVGIICSNKSFVCFIFMFLATPFHVSVNTACSYILDFRS